MIAPSTSIGARLHRIGLQMPGAAVPDGDGGFVQTYTDLSPATVFARITPATAADLERVASGTVISTATHIVTIPFHPQVTTQTRITFGTRTFSVTGVSNPEERNVELVLVAVEIVT